MKLSISAPSRAPPSLPPLPKAPLVNLKVSIGGTPSGVLTLTLEPSLPITCTNFLALVRANKYKSTKFHRVIPGFMIQGGDFTKHDGTGGHSANGGKFADERFHVVKHDKAGVLSMANSGPNTNGSQFFISLGRCSHLDGKHVAFGTVTSGFAVLEDIAAVETGERDKPIMLQTVKIDDAWVVGEEKDEGEEKADKKAEESDDDVSSSSSSSSDRKRRKKDKKRLVSWAGCSERGRALNAIKGLTGPLIVLNGRPGTVHS